MGKIIDIKSRQEISNKEQAAQEFLLLLDIANQYLKEAEKLQKKYNITFQDLTERQ
jgi:hypothetical protein